MLLQALQDSLGDVYDLQLDYRVTDFLFTNPSLLPASLGRSTVDEQVLVSEEGPLSIGVFLRAELLARLELTPPLRCLNEGNLADYWTALEGVSHFQCLAWCARHDRGVSLLELEMQAEIDKFLLSWWLLYAQTGRAPRELYHWLFARCVVDPGLCADRLEMYTRANRYAAWFCAALVKQLRYGSARPTAALLSQLRRFYRLSGPQKLHFIESQR